MHNMNNFFFECMSNSNKYLETYSRNFNSFHAYKTRFIFGCVLIYIYLFTVNFKSKVSILMFIFLKHKFLLYFDFQINILCISCVSWFIYVILYRMDLLHIFLQTLHWLPLTENSWKPDNIIKLFLYTEVNK